MALHTANLWGWRDPCITRSRREFIAKAACRQVAYDLGYSVSLAPSRLPLWYGSLNDAITTGENADPLSPSMSGRSAYIDSMEAAHPGYIRDLYRYAEGVLGPMATYKEIADCMNARSGASGDTRPTFSISRRQVAAWFAKQGGRETSPIEKPLLTTEHKTRRIEWAGKWFDTFCDPTTPVATPLIVVASLKYYQHHQRKKGS